MEAIALKKGLDAPLPTCPYGKSLYKPYIVGICGLQSPRLSREHSDYQISFKTYATPTRNINARFMIFRSLNHQNPKKIECCDLPHVDFGHCRGQQIPQIYHRFALFDPTQKWVPFNDPCALWWALGGSSQLASD